MGQQFLTPDERTRLIGLVSNLYDIQDGGARGRRSFMQDAAGLGQFTSGIDLNGSARLFARDLVGRMERHGWLAGRSSYHALGALLDACLSLGELDGEDARFVAGIMLRYGLVEDEGYLDSLRSQYDLDTSIIPDAPRPPIRPATAARDPAEEPDFAPQIGDEAALEAVIHSEDNFIDIATLEGAVYCGRAVARVEIPEHTAKGTGFLIGPDLLLTNQHVLKKPEYLDIAVVRFDFALDAAGVEDRGRTFRISDELYETSPPDALDYALVRLDGRPLEAATATGDDARLGMAELAAKGRHKGYLPMAPRVIVEGSRVNIIQHPDGRPQKVVLTQNYVVRATDTRVQYVADTMPGSSGAPVFNTRWELIGLHHSGKPYPSDGTAGGKSSWKGRYRVNEGIPIRAILEDLKTRGLERVLPRD